MVTVLLCWLVLSVVCSLALLAAAARPLEESHEQVLSNSDEAAVSFEPVQAMALPVANTPEPALKPAVEPVAAELMATV